MVTTLRYLPGVVTLEYRPDRCNGCRRCLEVCPQGVFDFVDRRARIVDRDACMECGACAVNCEGAALTVRSGVGCVAGVIKGLLKGTEPTCGCGEGEENQTAASGAC